MKKRLKRVYDWRLWDELKNGQLVYGIDLSDGRPKVIELWEYTVEQVARLMEQHRKTEYSMLLFYVLVEEEEDDEDVDC